MKNRHSSYMKIANPSSDRRLMNRWSGSYRRPARTWMWIVWMSWGRTCFGLKTNWEDSRRRTTTCKDWKYQAIRNIRDDPFMTSIYWCTEKPADINVDDGLVIITTSGCCGNDEDINERSMINLHHLSTESQQPSNICSRLLVYSPDLHCPTGPLSIPPFVYFSL